MFRGLLLCLVVLACMVSSCKPGKIVYPDPEPGYDAKPLSRYFPLRLGQSWTYALDSFRITELGIDSTSLYVQDSIIAIQTAGTTDTAYIVQRSTRPTTGGIYKKVEAFYLQRSGNEAQSIIAGTRVVKLKAPIAPGVTWDANAYNLNDTQGYLRSRYLQVDTIYGIGRLNYTYTTLVEVERFVNFISSDIVEERFAYDFGLIESFTERLSTQPGQPVVGIRVRQKLLYFRP